MDRLTQPAQIGGPRIDPPLEPGQTGGLHLGGTTGVAE